jgi:hypothetical protein
MQQMAGHETPHGLVRVEGTESRRSQNPGAESDPGQDARPDDNIDYAEPPASRNPWPRVAQLLDSTSSIVSCGNHACIGRRPGRQSERDGPRFPGIL